MNQDPAAEPGMIFSTNSDVYLDEPTVVLAWSGADRLYLLVEESRLPHWQTELQKKGSTFAKLLTCGTTVLLSNRR